MSNETQQETASDHPAGKITQVVAATGRKMRQSVETNWGQLTAFAAIFLVVGVILGLVIASFKADVASQQAPVAASSQVVPAPAPESSFKEEWESPFRQVSGFDSPDGKAYTCADDLTPVQVMMGQTYKRGGTTLTLSEDYREYTLSPQKAKLAVKLGAGDSMPGYILQTAYQAQFPTINNQVTFNASLGKGEETTYPLTRDYLPYKKGGNWIISVTACLK